MAHIGAKLERAAPGKSVVEHLDVHDGSNASIRLAVTVDDELRATLREAGTLREIERWLVRP